MNPIAGSGLNALTFDKDGNVYVSDSFNGIIWKTGPKRRSPQRNGAAIRCSGPGTGLTPPFGANGIAFNNAGTVLYVANTAFHQIIKIPVNADGTAGSPSIFITGINAPDGIAIDRDDNLWVCANQEDEIVVIDTDREGDRQARRFQWHRPEGHRARVSIPGESCLQQRPLNPLCLESDVVPAVCDAVGSRRRSTRPGRSRLVVTPCRSFAPKFRRSPMTMSNGCCGH